MQQEWLRTATRRYRPEYSNPEPLERTQNWIKLGGNVTYFFYIGMAAILASSTASAENGDVLKCTVSNFANTSNEGSTDKNFVEANMQKVFDIIDIEAEFHCIW